MTTINHRGGFRELDMTSIIRIHPEQAKERILAAVRAANGDLKAAAPVLDCTWRTLYRWIQKLGLDADLKKLADKGSREGWASGKRRPKAAGRAT
jgi:hypothetical protein